jgi:UDP:flavonoid glycosyltransferase YjiC (YdhE family)
MLDPHAQWDVQLGADSRSSCPPQLERVNDALKRWGIAPVDDIAALIDGDLVLVPTPPEFGSADGAPHFSAASDLPFIRVQDEQLPDGPCVAVTGLTAKPAVQAIQAVLRTGFDVLALAAERMNLPADLAGHPRVFALPIVDPDRYLPHAVLALHHGGAGSAVAAIRAGVPSVIVPTWTEQLLNGRALERRGAGKVVPVSEGSLEPVELRPHVQVLAHLETEGLEARLAAAIGQVAVDGTMRDRVRSWRSELLQMPGADRAADAIQRVAASSETASII